MLDYQREAFLRGQQTKLQHIHKQCVVEGLLLIRLSWDYATLPFCRERFCTDLVDVHSRMALRATAFHQGYQQEAGKRDVSPRSFLSFPHPQKKRMGRGTKRTGRGRKFGR